MWVYKCTKCGGQVPRSSEHCEHCGSDDPSDRLARQAKRDRRKTRKMVITISAAAILCVGAVYIVTEMVSGAPNFLVGDQSR